MSDMNMKFKLNPSALLAKGVSRSIICDVERKKYFLTPNSLYTILTDVEANTISEVLVKYSSNNAETYKIIEEYFDFLIEKDLIFFSEFIENYGKIQMGWDFPAIISNAIFDFDTNNLSLLSEIVPQLDALGCRFIQLRFMNNIDLEDLEKVIICFSNSIVENIDICFQFEDNLFSQIENFLIKYPRVNSITVYEYPCHQGFNSLNTQGRGKLFTYPDKITNKSCGIVKPFYFTSNISHFTEAQKHNTCFNRKISIDTEGYIRNCPSMKEHYGNIKDTTLQQALEHPDFKKYWFINKDQISVCKDCEFRYICTDCRAYIEDPKDILSKPLKCGYNPYTCEWEEWSTNPLKQKAIDYYGMRELVKSE